MSVIGKWVAESITGDMDKMFAANGTAPELGQKIKEFSQKNKAEITFSKSGDLWTMEIKKVLVEFNETFKSGEEFEHKAFGITFKIKIDATENKFTEIRRKEGAPADKPPMKIIREVRDGKLVCDMSVADASMTMTMTRVE